MKPESNVMTGPVAERSSVKETATRGAKTKKSLSKVREVGSNMIALLIAVLTWHILSFAVSSPFFPSPLDVVKAFIHLAEHGDVVGISLATHIWTSVYRLLAGFVLGVVFGVPLGLFMGLYKNVYRNMRSIIEPFRFIPPIAWIPLAIIFFSGLPRYAFLIFLGAFFPIFTATLIGVSRVEPIYRKVALVYGASKAYVLTHVVIPTVLPDILGGMRVGLGTAWMTIVAAEMTGGGSKGLGRMMINYAELLRIPEVVVAMILIGAIGFILNEALLLIEKYLFRWRWEVTL